MRFALISAASVLIIAGPAFSAQDSDLSGQKILQRDCGACHAVGKNGKSPLAAAPPFRTLPDKYDVEGLAEALAEGLEVGHTLMPEFSYPPEQIDRVITYLKSLQTRRPQVRTDRIK